MVLYQDEGVGQSPVLAYVVRTAFDVTVLAPGATAKESDLQYYCFLNLTILGSKYLDITCKKRKTKLNTAWFLPEDFL